MERLKHILSSRQFSLGFLVNLYKDTAMIEELLRTEEGTELLQHVMPGYNIGAFFWQESSRTLESFNAAGSALGADVFNERGSKKKNEKTGEEDWELIFSSASNVKGARLEDEFLAWAFCHRALILRTHRNRMAEKAAATIDRHRHRIGRDVPVINAGDRTNEHPTQALLDIYTMLQALGLDISRDWQQFEKYSIAFINDCKNGRTIHSLALLAGKLLKMRLLFIAPPGLEMPKEILEELRAAGVRFSEYDSFQQADIYYVTRNQIEYGGDRGGFVVTKRVADAYGVKAVLHPFPRSKDGNELPAWEEDHPDSWKASLDMDARNFYFKQMENGKPVRMALLKYLLKPHLELRKLKEEKLIRGFIAQCMGCKRVEYSEMGWTEFPPACGRVNTLPQIFCPKCRPPSGFYL